MFLLHQIAVMSQDQLTNYISVKWHAAESCIFGKWVIRLMVQKSQTTTWHEWNPVNNGISTTNLNWLAGFLNHQQHQLKLVHDISLKPRPTNFRRQGRVGFPRSSRLPVAPVAQEGSTGNRIALAGWKFVSWCLTLNFSHVTCFSMGLIAIKSFDLVLLPTNDACFSHIDMKLTLWFSFPKS